MTDKKEKPKQDVSLQKLVKIDSKGEDPAVGAILSDEFLNASDSDALDMALALQTVMRGNAAILRNLDTQNEQLLELKRQMAEYDSIARKWNDDREDFIERIDGMYERLRVSEEQREQFVAQESVRIQEMANMAKADARIKKQTIAQKLKEEPEETVVAPGELMTIRDGESFKTVVADTVISIGGVRYVLEPGVPTSVPKSVAERLRQMQLEKEEDSARKALLSASKIKKDIDVAEQWNEINKKYNSPTAEIMVRSDV